MGKTVVIKFGGNATEDRVTRKKIINDIVRLSKNNSVILVHGGGPQISRYMNEAGIKPRFVNGLRYTDPKTMVIAEKALGGINASIANQINKSGGYAFGMSCREGNTAISKKIVKLGLVGEIQKVDARLLTLLCKAKIVPVIMPVSKDTKNTTLNINADTAATEIAVAMKADILLFLTDVPGIKDAAGKVYKTVKIKEIDKLIKSSIITGGMIPKSTGCAQAVKRGIKQVQITDGKKGVSNSSGTVIKY
ncbi:MAG: acetylglutamate kinase [Elusimicrobia bacterium RIFOXYA2_FULL_39_19]|nr:MAG: acetylglutamate kinase [Elusimicrobia bacterium RIFOXYA2_FULL_39_19]